MRVLVACEFSGVVREAFRRRGHDAWSCDLLDAVDGSLHHYKDDVRYVLTRNDALWGRGKGWDLMIAHPPCTFLCNSGVRWLYSNNRGLEVDGDRWQNMKAGAEFFLTLINADIPRIAAENPVMHGYARKIIGRGPDQTIQPWQFGDEFKKRTCLWLKNLPPLVPTSDSDGSNAVAAVHREPPGPDRWKKRSITYKGIADAMADQWGAL